MAQEGSSAERVRQRALQRVREKALQLQAEKDRQRTQPQPTQARELTPPPDHRSVSEKAKDWLFSKEGGGATAVEIGVPAAAWSAGAAAGTAVGGPVGGLAGGAIAGGVSGYHASKKAQEMRGQPFSRRQAIVEAGVSALPPFLSRGKTAGQIVRRQAAKYGALAGGTSAAMEAGRQLDEGTDWRDVKIDPVQTGTAAVLGGTLGGGLSRVGARRLAGQNQAGTGTPRVVDRYRSPAAPRDPSLTSKAARAAAEKPAKKAAIAEAKKRIATAKGGKKGPQLQGKKGVAAPAKPDIKPAKATELVDPTGRRVAPIPTDPKKARQAANKIVSREAKALTKDLPSHADLQATFGQKVPADELSREDAGRILRKWFRGEDIGRETKARLEQHFGNLNDTFGRVQQQLEPLLTVIEADDATRVARAVAKPKKPKGPGRVKYSATPSGERAAKARAKKLNKDYPGSDARASRVIEYVGKGKNRKAKVRGWQVTSKFTRAKARGERPKLTGGEAKPELLGRRIGAKMADEKPPLPDEDLVPIDQIDGPIPDDVASLLSGGSARDAEIAAIPTKIPRGSTPDDWDAIPIGTKELSQDFARRAKEAGHDVWIQPGTKKSKYTVYVPKGTDVTDLASEYGVGRAQRVAPGEALPRQEAPRVRMDRPDRGVKLRGEQQAESPTATIGEALRAKGRELPAPPVEPEAPRAAYKPEAPVQKSQIDQYLTKPSAKARAEDVGSAPTEGMIARARTLTDEQLQNASVKAQDPRVRNAALDELEARSAHKPDAELEQLRARLPKASSVEQGQIRKRMRQLMEDETGSVHIPFWHRKPQVKVLEGEERLDKLLVAHQADLAGLGKRSGAPYIPERIKRWSDKEWALRWRTNEAIKDGQVWDAMTNPLKVLRRLRGGGTQSRIDLYRADMADAYQHVRKNGLEEAYIKYLDLSSNVRAQATTTQHLVNARAKLSDARTAYMAARGKGVKGKKLNKLKRAVGFAKKELTSAQAEWARMERGRGLPGGFKPDESEQLLARMKEELGPEQWAHIKDAANVHAQINDQVLQDSVASGLISEAMAAQYRARGEYVAPIQRIASTSQAIYEQKMVNAAHHKLLGIKEKDVQLLMKFEGDARPSSHPITAAMGHVGQVIRQADENRIAVNIVDQFRQIPRYQPWIKKVNESTPLKDPELAKIPIWRAGRQEWWTLPRDLAEITANPGRLRMEMMSIGPLSLMRSLRTLVTRSATTWRPSFLLGRNPPRDIGESRFNLPQIYNLGDPIDYANHAGEYLKAAADLISDPRGLRHADIRDFQLRGAGLSTLQESIRPEAYISKRLMDQLTKMGKQASEGGFARGKELAGELIGAADAKAFDFASAMEMASKLVSYRRLIEKGYIPEEAAYLARTFGGGPDYAVGGTLKDFADTLLIFFTPSLRGIEQTFMAMKMHRQMPAIGLQKPTEAMKRGLSNAYAGDQQYGNVLARLIKAKGPRYMSRAFGTMLAATAGYVAWNHRFKDENGEPYIQRVPAWVRNNNWVLFIPGGPMMETEYGDMPSYFTWPKPHSRVFLQSPMEKTIYRGMGERTEFAGGDDGHGDAATRFLADAFEAASPVGVDLGGSDSLMGDVTNALTATANPAIGIPSDLMRNTRSMTGGPIIGRRELEAMPEDQFSSMKKDSVINRGVAALNRQYREVMGRELGVPPGFVEHAMERLSPGAMEVGGEVSETIRGAFGEGRDPGAYWNVIERISRTYPIIGGVFKSLVGPGGGQDPRVLELRSDFYRYADAARRRYASAQLQVEREDKDWAREYYKMVPPAQQNKVRLAMNTLVDKMAEAHAKRGELAMDLMEATDPAEQARIKEEQQKISNRELAFLRRWRKEMDEVEGKTRD